MKKVQATSPNPDDAVLPKEKNQETFCEKKPPDIGLYPKGQFSKNTVYLERGMPYLAFVYTNAVLVRKIDKP